MTLGRTVTISSLLVDSALSHVPTVVRRNAAVPAMVTGIEMVPSRAVVDSAISVHVLSMARFISTLTTRPATGDLSLSVKPPLSVKISPKLTCRVSVFSIVKELLRTSGAIASATFRIAVVAATSSIPNVQRAAPPKRYFATRFIRSA